MKHQTIVFLVDDVTKRFGIFASPNFQVYNYSDILSYKIIHHTQTVSTTSGNGVEAALGSAAFGTTGAIVGAAGPRRTVSRDETLYITVVITLNRLDTPLIEIIILNDSYKEVMASLEYIQNFNYSH